MKFFNQLLDNSRFLTVLYDNLPDEIKTSQLYSDVALYLENYADFNKISADNAIEYYTCYVSAYNKHCKLFVKSSKYPMESGDTSFSLNRDQYDVVLLISVLFAAHRYRIMQLLKQEHANGKALFIGTGPGLEIMLTKDWYSEIHVYDLSVNKFLFSQFNDIYIRTELYTGQKKNYFDAIYLIELLEHLQEPFKLLETSAMSLKKDGMLFLTTATDIPQFDHAYNFPMDHTHFEDQVKQMGFSVIKKEMIPHNYLKMEIKSYNHFYTLKKNAAII